MQLKGLPAVTPPAAGHVTLTTSGWPLTVTVADPDALALFASVTVKLSVFEPLEFSVLLMVPVPVYGPVPPVADTVQLNGLPTVTPPAAGHETVTTRGCGATETLAEPDALALFASVTVKDSVLVPLLGSVLLIVPVPVYGPVPPVAVTVQLNGLPAVTPLVGHVAVTTSGCPPTVTPAVPVADTPLASVTVKDSVLVPLVFSVLEIVPTPVYGPVSPDAETVQLNGLPTVTPEVGQVTVTTRGVPATLTVAEPDAVTELASVTVKVSVLLPFVASVRLKVPVPV